jgi:hypothetical protein
MNDHKQTAMADGSVLRSQGIPARRRRWCVSRAPLGSMQPKSSILVKSYSSMEGLWNISGIWSSTIRHLPKLTRSRRTSSGGRYSALVRRLAGDTSVVLISEGSHCGTLLRLSMKSAALADAPCKANEIPYRSPYR